MSAFTTTMLQAITIGIGVLIGFLFNKTNPKWWKVVLGFLLGFVLSWFLGVIIWAYIFVSSDFTLAISSGMFKSFLFAIVGGGLGVYLGRRYAKQNMQENT
jgi:RsiW-degrading membrane proteinase PrsW (M82 family)